MLYRFWSFFLDVLVDWVGMGFKVVASEVVASEILASEVLASEVVASGVPLTFVSTEVIAAVRVVACLELGTI